MIKKLIWGGKRQKQVGQSQGYTLTIHAALVLDGYKVAITSIIHHMCAAQTVCWIARQGQQRFKSNPPGVPKKTLEIFPGGIDSHYVLTLRAP